MAASAHRVCGRPRTAAPARDQAVAGSEPRLAVPHSVTAPAVTMSGAAVLPGSNARRSGRDAGQTLPSPHRSALLGDALVPSNRTASRRPDDALPRNRERPRRRHRSWCRLANAADRVAFALIPSRNVTPARAYVPSRTPGSRETATDSSRMRAIASTTSWPAQRHRVRLADRGGGIIIRLVRLSDAPGLRAPVPSRSTGPLA